MSDIESATPLSLAATILGEIAMAPVRTFSTRDFGREPFVAARSALVPEDVASTLLNKLRSRLPAGTLAFIGTTCSLATPKADGVELVVAAGKSQFDILRIAASNAVNFGLETEDLVSELQEWEQEFGIDIWQAETDAIQLRLNTLPENIGLFAARIYEFCPDIVDQGSGDLKELETALTATQELYLWWD